MPQNKTQWECWSTKWRIKLRQKQEEQTQQATSTSTFQTQPDLILTQPHKIYAPKCYLLEYYLDYIIVMYYENFWKAEKKIHHSGKAVFLHMLVHKFCSVWYKAKYVEIWSRKVNARLQNPKQSKFPIPPKQTNFPTAAEVISTIVQTKLLCWVIKTLNHAPRVVPSATKTRAHFVWLFQLTTNSTQRVSSGPLFKYFARQVYVWRITYLGSYIQS